MARKTKLKTAAMPVEDTPQGHDQCAEAIGELGRLKREHARVLAAANDQVATILAQAQPALKALKDRIDAKQRGIHAWCEVHRADLTDGNKVKYAEFVTGKVTWRADPPSVTVRNAPTVIQTLKQLGLLAFVRTVEEVNKEAILAEASIAKTATLEEAAKKPEVAMVMHRMELLAGLSNLTIVTGREQFGIEPFEAEAPAGAAISSAPVAAVEGA